ncbi:hypothetical protein GCM10028817_11200 [Spirosoma pomorum]
MLYNKMTSGHSANVLTLTECPEVFMYHPEIYRNYLIFSRQVSGLAPELLRDRVLRIQLSTPWVAQVVLEV